MFRTIFFLSQYINIFESQLIALALRCDNRLGIKLPFQTLLYMPMLITKEENREINIS